MASGLTVRKLADENREFAGLVIEGGAPETARVPTSFVSRGLSEGWIEAEGGEPVFRPGGPPEDLWRSDALHVFTHYRTITFKTVDGDVRYRVVHQPDKYVDDAEDEAKVTDEIYAAGETRVDYFYDLELS